jgi:hypothetical protein
MWFVSQREHQGQLARQQSYFVTMLFFIIYSIAPTPLAGLLRVTHDLRKAIQLSLGAVSICFRSLRPSFRLIIAGFSGVILYVFPDSRNGLGCYPAA